MDFNEINDQTGFMNGEQFESEEQVRDYFTAQNQYAMVGDDAVTDSGLLQSWADAVIESRQHCKF